MAAARMVKLCGSSPMTTVGQPTTMIPPWLVGSVRRAADRLLMSTVDEPLRIVSAGPIGAQTRRSRTRAAGRYPTITLALPENIGPPTCGTGPGSTFGQR